MKLTLTGNRLKAPKKESRAKTKLLRAQRRRRRRQHAGAKISHGMGAWNPRPKTVAAQAPLRGLQPAPKIPNEGDIDPRIMERYGRLGRGRKKAGE